MLYTYPFLINCVTETGEMEAELTAAREEIERLKDHCRIKVKALINQTSERMKAEQQRDRLAEALQKVVTSWDEATWLDENEFESFREALQSLNQPTP